MGKITTEGDTNEIVTFKYHVFGNEFYSCK